VVRTTDAALQGQFTISYSLLLTDPRHKRATEEGLKTVNRIPMSQEGRRLAAKRREQMARWGRIGVFALSALAGVLLVIQL
jgi:hypothetical protein